MAMYKYLSEAELQQEFQFIQDAVQDMRKFTVLYDKFYEPVFAFIYKRTYDEQLTADLTSDVFLKAMTKE